MSPPAFMTSTRSSSSTIATERQLIVQYIEVTAGNIDGNSNRLGAIHYYNTDSDVEARAWLSQHASRVDEMPTTSGKPFTLHRINEIFEDERFRRCLNNEGATLVLEGDMGTGKSMTMLGLRRKLQDWMHPPLEQNESPAEPDTAKKQPTINRAIVYPSVFLSTTEVNDRQAERVLMYFLQSLLHFNVRGGLECIKELYKEFKAGDYPQTTHIVNTITKVLVEEKGPVCFFLDGLNECASESREEILKSLKKIQEKCNIGIVMTDRTGVSHWPKHFNEGKSWKLGANKTEFRDYLKQRLNELPQLRNDRNSLAWTQETPLCNEVIQTIIESSRDMFLLIELNFQYISNSNGKADVRAKLEDMKTLTSDDDGRDVYGEVVRNAFSRNLTHSFELQDRQDELQRALAYLRDSMRPLSKIELGTLLSLKSSRNRLLKDDPRSWTDIQQMGQGLISENNESVSFIHPSLAIYLNGIEGREKVPSVNDSLGTLCVSYLSLAFESNGICQDQTNLTERLEKWPFLDYAARYWSDHFRRFNDSHRKQDIKLYAFHRATLEFLKKTQDVESAFQITLFPDKILEALRPEVPSGKQQIRRIILWKGSIYESTNVVDPFKPSRVTGLVLACLFDFPSLVPELIQSRGSNEVEISTTNALGITPIHAAVMAGSEANVECLLNANECPTTKNARGFTPLMTAIMKGNLGVAKILLKRGAVRDDINARTNLPTTHGGQKLEYDIQNYDAQLRPNNHRKDFREVGHRTVLHQAARQGREDILRLLLDIPGINKDIPDSQGQTALHKAAKKGRIEAVKLLIGEGSDPYRTTGQNISHRHSWLLLIEGIISWLLLIFWTKPQKRITGREDWEGRNILHLAITNPQSKEMIRYLSENYPRLCLDSTSKGYTPLFLAAQLGPLENLEILWKPSEEMVKSRTVSGETLLHAAAKADSPDMLKYILEKDILDVNVEDKEGNTPLHDAVMFGQTENVKILIEQANIHIDKPTKGGERPIDYANKFPEIANLLKRQKHIERNTV